VATVTDGEFFEFLFYLSLNVEISFFNRREIGSCVVIRRIKYFGAEIERNFSK
jgi:hypothetical protein